MKLTVSIFAILVLFAGSTRAAQSEADKPVSPAPAPVAAATAGAKPGKLPFYQELDKIDDVNPYVIKSVIIEGNKLISRGQIKAAIKTRAGDFYHRKDMEEDLKAIYKLGYFDGQELHVAAETTAAGMVINIHVKENPFLKSIVFSGNHIVPTGQLQELFKDQLQKPRSRTQLAASLKAAENLYKTQGYLLTRATAGRDEPEGTLPVTIDEGLIQEVKISGLSEEQKQIVLEALTLKAGSPYNEKQLATDLKTAIKSGKIDELQRQVDKSKATGGYILTISTVPKNQEVKQKAAPAPLLNAGKSKPALPVLNRLIHSPMYKNIK